MSGKVDKKGRKLIDEATKPESHEFHIEKQEAGGDINYCVGPLAGVITTTPKGQMGGEEREKEKGKKKK